MTQRVHDGHRRAPKPRKKTAGRPNPSGRPTIASTYTSDQPNADVTTSMGVSAGDGLIHYVLLTRDSVGRSVVESRVIDLDTTDGLTPASRVNAGIDLLLDAARDGGRKVGAIGVTARTEADRRRLRSNGSGPRRQVQLCQESEAVSTHLSGTGVIDRFARVVVADCGDTGMSLYTLDPATGEVDRFYRTPVLSGRGLDKRIADRLTASDEGGARVARRGQASLLAACRTAKEEPVDDDRGIEPDETSSATVDDAAGRTDAPIDRLRLSAQTVADAVRPMVDDARGELVRYLAAAPSAHSTEAVVLIGGLANIAAVRSVADGTGLEVVRPDRPELVAATGAAAMATDGAAATRLAFLGSGRVRRQRFSAVPIAVAVAVLAASLMAVYAVGTSLAGQHDPVAQTSATPTDDVTVTSDAASTTLPRTTRAGTHRPPTAPAPVTTGLPERATDPGWLTTELPPAQPSEGTRTLVPTAPVAPVRPPSPTPAPSSPSVPPSTSQPSLPLIPPDLLPPELLPPTPPSGGLTPPHLIQPRQKTAPKSAAPKSPVPQSPVPQSPAPKTAAPSAPSQAPTTTTTPTPPPR